MQCHARQPHGTVVFGTLAPEPNIIGAAVQSNLIPRFISSSTIREIPIYFFEYGPQTGKIPSSYFIIQYLHRKTAVFPSALLYRLAHLRI